MLKTISIMNCRFLKMKKSCLHFSLHKIPLSIQSSFIPTTLNLNNDDNTLNKNESKNKNKSNNESSEIHANANVDSNANAEKSTMLFKGYNAIVFSCLFLYFSKRFHVDFNHTRKYAIPHYVDRIPFRNEILKNIFLIASTFSLASYSIYSVCYSYAERKQRKQRKQ